MDIVVYLSLTVIALLLIVRIVQWANPPKNGDSSESYMQGYLDVLPSQDDE